MIMDRKALKATLALGSIFSLRMFGLFMILPIFSVFAAQLNGATPALIGLALGIYGLTQGLFQLPFGMWSDFVSRKKVIFIGLLLFALGSVIAALSHNIYSMIVGRAIQGAGAIGSTTIALVSDLTEEQHRTHAIALIGITIGLSFVLAIVLGPALAHWFGVSGIFWLTTLLALIALFILYYAVPNASLPKRAMTRAELLQQLRQVVSESKLLRLDLSIFILHALLTATFFALPILFIQMYHVSFAHQWQIYLPVFFLALLFIGSCMRGKHFAKQEKRWVTVNIFLIVIAQGVFFLSAAMTNRLVFYFGLYLFLQSFTFLEALLPSQVSKAISSDFRGSAMGVFSSSQFLGIFVGGLWSGFLNGHFHLTGIFLANGCVALLWLLVMIPLPINKKPF